MEVRFNPDESRVVLREPLPEALEPGTTELGSLEALLTRQRTELVAARATELTTD